MSSDQVQGPLSQVLSAEVENLDQDAEEYIKTTFSSMPIPA